MSVISGIAKTSVHIILKKKNYKPMICQELKSSDKEKRLEFCQQVEKMVLDQELDLSDLIFSDESHVYLKGKPNT